MYKHLLFILTLLVASFSSEAKGYNFTVKINGLKDSLCYLGNYYGDKQYLQDSSYADTEGKVTFKSLDKDLPKGVYLIVLPGKRYFEFLLNDSENILFETDINDLNNNMVVKGSKENVVFYDYLRFITKKQAETAPLKMAYDRFTQTNTKDSIDHYRKKINNIDVEVKAYKQNIEKQDPKGLLTAIFKNSVEPVIPDRDTIPASKNDTLFAYKYYKEHYFDHLDFSDERILRSPIFFNKINYYLTSLTPQIPDSINISVDVIVSKARANPEIFKFCVHWITYNYETSKMMGMDAVFVHMVDKYYTADQTPWLESDQLYRITNRANELRPLLIGKQVKNLILKDENGQPKSLYDLKSKYTLLYFWDPDCSHCKKETPVLRAQYNELKSRGLEVYAVCTEIEVEKWKSFIKENDLKWINVADLELKNTFRSDFDIKSTPQVFLLDKNKIILAKKINVEQIQDVLNQIEKQVN